jgi:hypothetical protein
MNFRFGRGLDLSMMKLIRNFAARSLATQLLNKSAWSAHNIKYQMQSISTKPPLFSWGIHHRLKQA